MTSYVDCICKCPSCKSEYLTDYCASYNTFNLTIFSDGYSYIPILTEYSIGCVVCKNVFDKSANTIEQFDLSDHKKISSSVKKSSLEEKEVITLLIENKRYGKNTKEIDILLTYLWIINHRTGLAMHEPDKSKEDIDKLITDKSITIDHSPEYDLKLRSNNKYIDRLLYLLLKSKKKKSLLLIAEIYREQMEFDKAIKTLNEFRINKYQRKRWRHLYESILSRVEDGNPMVFQVKK